jgi:Fe-S-cluster containining protein
VAETVLNNLLDCYGVLLRDVDLWFQNCCRNHSNQILCRNGCSSCCRGLFDITLLDALYLKRGVDLLPSSVQQSVKSVAQSRLNSLSHRFPLFTKPWLLNGIPEDEWEQLMPEEDETPCVLLSEAGGCLVYDHRPMTCRLNGIPLIDVSGEELFDEWCTLNFTRHNPRLLHDIRFRFRELFSDEQVLFHELTCHVTGSQVSEIDLFIPAATVLDLDRVVATIKK